MKIGLSYSRCVRDIVEGRVDIDDVLVIIARTDFDPNDDKQWANMWSAYGGGNPEFNPVMGFSRMGFSRSAPEWAGQTDEALFRSVSVDLWKWGKLHQPRKFGAHPSRRGEYWLETVLPDSELETRPAVKEAWDQFQMLAGLTNVKLDREYR
jgi:hypothetical protein